jgi:ribosomal protein S18 acetylase RimI-like enzyme
LPNENDLFELYSKLDWNNFLNLPSNKLLTAMKQSIYGVYVYYDDKLIGTGRIVSDGVINAYVCGLGVLSEHRNQGVGTKIMEMLKEFCLNQNLHMQFICDESLVSYYSKLGFNQFAVGMRY